MRFLLSFVLLVAVSANQLPCPGKSSTFSIDKLSFGSMTNAHSASGLIANRVDGQWIEVPNAVYDSILDTLKAQPMGRFHGVPCSEIKSYPDLVFNVNGSELRIPATAYVNQKSESNGLCELFVMNRPQSNPDYVVPYALAAEVCPLTNEANPLFKHKMITPWCHSYACVHMQRSQRLSATNPLCHRYECKFFKRFTRFGASKKPITPWCHRYECLNPERLQRSSPSKKAVPCHNYGC
ncbi:Peptidase A1 domain-containing protein [Aphelenchoides besseyi]|nr:Peptidase A1 domain-containing protein [Aphelenchoides besseyi]